MNIKKTNDIIKIGVYLLLILFFISCDNREPYQILLEQSGLKLLETYHVDSTILRNVNEYNWITYLEISDSDCKRTIKEIDQKIDFKNVNTTSEYYDKYRSENDTLYGYLIGSVYYFGWHYNRYEIYEGRQEMSGFTSYDFSLDTITNKLEFSFWNE